MNPDLLAHVVDFVAARQRLAMTRDDLQRVTTLVLDAIGCQLGGAREDAPRRAARCITDERPGAITDAAAFRDGVALRDLDFLDVYSSVDVCHPAENIPVARVIAERQQESGLAFLRAVATAYEVQCRFADAFDVRDAGLHHTTMANVTVPVIAACLGELSLERLGDAISLALARGLVLRSISQGDVSQAKAMAFPLAARGAGDCVRLAEAGVSGPSRALTDLTAMVQGDPKAVAAHFQRDVEGSPRLKQVRLKPYPVQYALQAVVEAGILLHHRLGERVAGTTQVEVIAGRRVLSNTTDPLKRRPTNRETADHSLYAAVAMALKLGRLAVQDLRDAAWSSAAAQRLASLTTVQPAPGAGTIELTDPLAASVSVCLRDGTVERVTVTAPLGGPTRPLSERQVTAKFCSLADAVVGAERSAAIIAAVEALPTRPNMVGFGELMSP